MLEHQTHPIYSKANCKFDCYVNLAFQECKCVPWDLVNKIQNAGECDIFGRVCFFGMIENLAHGSDQNCTHCIDDCNWIRYRKTIKERKPLTLKKVEFIFFGESTLYCNEYICISPR